MKKSKKSVVFFEKEGPIGGGQIVLLNLLDSNQDDINPYVILSGKNSTWSILKKKGIHTFVVPSGHYKNISKSALDFIKFAYFSTQAPYKYTRIVRMIRPDCIYINAIQLAPWVSLLGLFLKVPIIWHVHHYIIDAISRKFVEQFGKLEMVRKLICVSEKMREQFPTLRHKSIVIYNGVDTNLFYPVQDKKEILRREVGIPSKKIVIANIGQIIPSKGQDFLLNALKDFLKDYGIVLLIIGSPHPHYLDFYEKLKLFSSRYNLLKNVKFLGFKEDIENILRTVDILVVSSTYKFEGCPMVILEAMASGLPVVAPNLGGIPEVVEDGVTGFIYKKEDKKELVDCLKTLVCDSALRKSMGEKAREIAVNKFSMEIFHHKIRSVIEEVTKG